MCAWHSFTRHSFRVLYIVSADSAPTFGAYIVNTRIGTNFDVLWCADRIEFDECSVFFFCLVPSARIFYFLTCFVLLLTRPVLLMQGGGTGAVEGRIPLRTRVALR